MSAEEQRKDEETFESALRLLSSNSLGLCIEFSSSESDIAMELALILDSDRNEPRPSFLFLFFLA